MIVWIKEADRRATKVILSEEADVDDLAKETLKVLKKDNVSACDVQFFKAVADPEDPNKIVMLDGSDDASMKVSDLLNCNGGYGIYSTYPLLINFVEGM